jgi:hypothetical protein
MRCTAPISRARAHTHSHSHTHTHTHAHTHTHTHTHTHRYVDVVAKSGEAAGVEFLSNFSSSSADAVTDKWAALWTELFVRYRDGLVVGPPTPPAKPRDQPPPPDCESTGYDAEWYKRVIADTGDRYRVPTALSESLAAHQRRKALLLSHR